MRDVPNLNFPMLDLHEVASETLSTSGRPPLPSATQNEINMNGTKARLLDKLMKTT